MKKSAPPPAPKRTAKKAAPAPKKASACPIVGIGASAGGLEALVQFLAHVPKDSGMAYVIVQHLDPTQKGMMPELLQRATKLKVMQVKDRTRAEPNCVYVIPPNSDMSVLRGVLHLMVPVEMRGLRLPIDFFFRSLAEDQREQSVGIILSGMGSDGTLGLRAIKEKAGIVLVQDPASAKFDAMPRSVIDAGLADIVATAEELPEKLIAYRRHVPQLDKSELHLEEKVQSALEKIVILLRGHSGHDFTLYRRSTLYRRVERRMGIHQVAKISGYVRYLQENPQELGILFKELLIGVTNFFRDKTAWEQLATKALPLLLKDRPAGSILRAWVAGCSTGEEAYTLAMVFKETLKNLKCADNVSLQIYATDLDKDAIDKARQGLFPENIVADVSPSRLTRFFIKEETGYRVNKEIRSMVVFAPQNLIMDPPFTRLDLLCCRNLLIYLTPELQRKLFPLFHYSLNPGGVLFLGSAESIGNFTHLFTALALKERIFQRNETAMQGSHLDFPAVYVPTHTIRQESQLTARVPAPSLQAIADQMLQQRYAPPAVLVNEHGDILYISGKTGKFLEPAAGKANWNVIAMAHDGLRVELSSAMQKVIRKKGTATVRGIKLGPPADTRAVDILVQAIEEPKELFGMILIVFSETIIPASSPFGRATGKAASSSSARQRELQNELKHARDEVQAGREEMQTSQEELKSMNEELQSTNEELQSTNEELMTSKEEMQSLNEELQTVNAELQAKLDELSGANNDMKNLLNSTDIATVFLDNDLHVRRFTLQAKTIIKFIASDVGRPITDLASDLLYPELVTDAHEVLRTLVFSERSIATQDGRWFTVRIMPYRTMDNRIDGVVITFADITAAKKIEADLREQHSQLTQQAVEQSRALDKALGKPKGRRVAAPQRKSKL
ncbi:chemotaxis protein CheB [Prosthecobacter sp.]|jgi:two-component system CheB/CheR fusion protein|uniref:chemotaxis protein CheB n=1 Tax=Prosthecobacter sp. TaxID=1965333 RepID=UPI0037CB0121